MCDIINFHIIVRNKSLTILMVKMCFSIIIMFFRGSPLLNPLQATLTYYSFMSQTTLGLNGF